MSETISFPPLSETSAVGKRTPTVYFIDDSVITDVIMPDQDGYSVCSQIKQHERFSRTPVILMSGVVNKGVADKAVAVGADELIRKPFQPVDLIARVKSFLEPKSAQPPAPALPTTPRVPG